jgi:hypothetical protein
MDKFSFISKPNIVIMFAKSCSTEFLPLKIQNSAQFANNSKTKNCSLLIFRRFINVAKVCWHPDKQRKETGLGNRFDINC